MTQVEKKILITRSKIEKESTPPTPISPRKADGDIKLV
jgi:hypothetical protein